MGLIDPKRLTLPDGHAVWVRTGHPDDGEAMLVVDQDQRQTDPHRIHEGGEGRRTEGEWRQRLTDEMAHPTCLMLVASPGPTPGSGVLGWLSFRGESLRKMQHRGTLGILVLSTWRGRGLGSALIGACLDWAWHHPGVEKVELTVFASNVGARRLYRRLGFRPEGRSRRHFKMLDGRVIDDVKMAIYTKPGIAPPGFQAWRAEGAGRG